jgi:RNA polymerase sigma factor (sigma-70 family)
MSGLDDSDEALINRYGQGDVTSFATLYRRHEMRVWRYIKRNVSSRAIADELMQEVWFAVARDAPRYEPTARFTTWLFTIARNRVIDALRAKRREVSLDALGQEGSVVLEQLTTGTDVGPLAAVVVRDQASALSRAIGQLPEDQRDAFLLQVEGDLSVEEVAAITRSSFETTKSRLRYARAKLRVLLGEYA